MLQLDQLVASQIQPQYARPKLEKNILNGMLKGFIDLVFEYQGKYYVARLQVKLARRRRQCLSFCRPAGTKILASRYDMQYVIYTYALHKLLQVRLGGQLPFMKSMSAGVVYLFLRGHRAADSRGAFYDQVPLALIEQLDELFMGSSEPLHSIRAQSNQTNRKLPMTKLDISLADALAAWQEQRLATPTRPQFGDDVTAPRCE